MASGKHSGLVFLIIRDRRAASVQIVFLHFVSNLRFERILGIMFSNHVPFCKTWFSLSFIMDVSDLALIRHNFLVSIVEH